ncbi:hypothetical protein BGT96224_2931 [Blumeria graminis f. sp. tritici 96224]|uniref:FAD/NAD(P)-binding domain-containing protein n=1 Tax=Blumeria graminis f. sp. tritici 96224 TaxID=1268274 RepID=A0A656KL78_BLUGR|nr:hypothetical protein BGT96224_2931 [Blumeria graminis f. sp. tritici 96224]
MVSVNVYTLLYAFGFLATCTAGILKEDSNQDSTVDYDVVIVGGGPAGLSALSSLGRVRRRALLIDSGEYRNNNTRANHDVLGSDGLPPSLFRARARDQISRYTTTSSRNGTVTSISSALNGSFVTTLDDGQEYTSRKIVLATGIIDIVPQIPGFSEAWGRGMYWCAWCDSWEHRDQSLGVLGSIEDAVFSTFQVMTMNKDIVAFVNGTDTPANRALLDKKLPGWQQQITKIGAVLENRTIASIERLQDGNLVRNITLWKEYDSFQVTLEDSTKIQRDSFIVSLKNRQRSYLGDKIGVKIKNERMMVNPASMLAAPGVYAVGDANNDSTTNVPHALFTGKKAGVFAHGTVDLWKTDVKNNNVKRSEHDLMVEEDNEVETLWKRMSQAYK